MSSKAYQLPKGTKVQALFDFKGAAEEDLVFKKGDFLTVESTSEDPNWWLASNLLGKRGMIPANYVEPVNEASKKSTTLPRDASGALLPMPWFHGKITREFAEELLKPREEGLYLVRESTNFPGDYTLCVCSAEGTVDHYRVQGIDGRLSVDEEAFFDSLEDLIKHYQKDSDGLCARLIKPLLKKDGLELVDARALAAWEIPRRAIVRVKPIGSGQFGEVFEGTYGGKQVAIKTLKDVDDESKKSFLAEADVMSKLKHPNLVELIGVVTNGNPMMVISEFMAKGCLLDYLRSRGRSVVTPDLQMKFTRNVCAAMVYLEAQNFVHRDLAARNILLSEDSIAKVADFGLARDSRFGQVDVGKLPIKWTAPEALKLKHSTSKSDVWSFGVVMWEIYSYGRTPYPKLSQKEVVENVTKGYRMESPEGCSKDVYDVMLACWEIDPIKRPTFKKLEGILAKL
eukprot:m.648991 g.648991  ORF g.648991 m.648991 type:complete len:456 (+) comp58388_c0_seq2:251-1618(+)